MRKTETIDGQEVTLATITVGAIEKIEVAGKTGRAFNRALVACSILAAGDSERGTEAWADEVQVFAPKGVKPAFKRLLDAANLVNYFETEEEQAANDNAIAGAVGRKPKGESEPEAPAGA
jgi:hypothetical protein